jgi:hypothetical protein
MVRHMRLNSSAIGQRSRSDSVASAHFLSDANVISAAGTGTASRTAQLGQRRSEYGAVSLSFVSRCLPALTAHMMLLDGVLTAHFFSDLLSRVYCAHQH